MEAIGVILIIAVYFLPTIVGWKTEHSNGIMVLNLFLGWTFIGWVGAFIWAATSKKII